MPWTAEDASDFNEGLSEDEKEQWASVANSSLESCLNDGGSQEDCEAKAIREANGVVNNRQFNTLKLQTNHYELREEEYDGETHLVAPVVVFVEGVHRGSDGPILHVEEELSHYTDAWNGTPVTVGHPEEENRYVSANQAPEIAEKEIVGKLFNVYMDEGKLKGEVWVNKEELKEEAPRAYRNLKNKEPMDVSAGVFTDNENSQGTYEEQEYQAIARNYRPDHIALLPDETGACSWGDGCGIRVNQKLEGEDDMKLVVNKKEDGFNLNVIQNNARESARTPDYDGTETKDWSGVDKTVDAFVAGYWKHHPDANRPEDEIEQVDDMPAAMKSWIASKTLLGDSDADNADDLIYFPVVNPDTDNLNEGGLTAAARLSGRGLSESQQNSVQNRVEELMEDEFDEEMDTNELVKDYDIEKVLIRNGLKLNQYGKVQLARDIQEKLDGMDNDVKVHYLVEVFDDEFIYRVMNNQTGDESFYKDSYSTENKKVTLGGDPIEVTKNVSYEEVNTNQEGALMSNEQEDKCPDCLIESELTAFTEEDRDWLDELSEQQINQIQDTVKETKETIEANVNDNEGTISKEDVKEALQSNIESTEDFIEFAPDEIGEHLSHGLKVHKQQRNKLIEAITDNSDFTEDELEGKDIEELEKTAKLAVNNKKGDNNGNYYKLNSGSSPQTNDTNDVPTLAGTSGFKENKGE